MTARVVITDALAQLNAIDAQETPDAYQAARGLRILQQLILSLPGMTHWTDVEVSANYTAGENERIRASGSVTVTIPSAVASTSTLLWCCNEVTLLCEGYDDRAPRDGARVQVVEAEAVTYYYCADTGLWTRADSLELGSDIPLNADMIQGLTAILAVELSPYEGLPPTNVTAGIAAATLSRMRARYGQRQAIAAPLTVINTSSNNPYFGMPLA